MVSADDTLGIVIVNYRTPDLLERSIDALQRSERRPDELVVVDVDPVGDPSPDTDLRAHVIRTDDNPGYAAACNRGAAATTSDWVLFLNADVFVSPSCVGGVLGEVAGDADVGIATCRLVRPDGQMDHACHRGLPSVADSLAYKMRLDRLARGSRRLGHYRLSWLDPLGTHDVEACSGAFLLIRRSVLEHVGGWDERYRFYAEDLDLCARAAAAGWRIRYVGTETATHVKSASSHFRRSTAELTTEQRATRRRTRVAAVDAHERYYEQHMEVGTARPLRPLVRLMFAVQRRRAAGA